MTGLPEFNFPAFDKAARRYRDQGYYVINPAEHDREEGLDVTGMTGDPAELEGKFDLKTALLWDLSQIAEVDAIVLLYRWHTSGGCRAELAFAAALGKVAILDGRFGFGTYPAKSLNLYGGFI